ncbi:hypothetical protein [Aggregatibacter sp.]
MKPFDLKEALAGKPCVSENGKIIYIFKDVREFGFDDDTPLVGIIIFNKNNYMLTHWSDDGKNYSSYDYQIAGMYEEPELTSEQVLEKAFNEDLFVAQSTNVNIKLKVIAKSKDGVFVLEADNGFVSKSCDGEYVLYKDPVPKSNTITVTLPKPFNPKVGNAFYFISDSGEVLVAHFDPGYISHVMAKDTGRCFRTESDAQAWLDAMKNALDD